MVLCVQVPLLPTPKQTAPHANAPGDSINPPPLLPTQQLSHHPAQATPAVATTARHTPDQLLDLTQADTPPTIQMGQSQVATVSVPVEPPQWVQAMTVLFASAICDAVTMPHTVAPLANPLDAAFADTTSMLTGVELTWVLSWCGIANLNELPPFWKVFDSAKTHGLQQQVLTSFLKEVFCHNPFVQFMV